MAAQEAVSAHRDSQGRHAMPIHSYGIINTLKGVSFKIALLSLDHFYISNLFFIGAVGGLVNTMLITLEAYSLLKYF